MFSRNTYQQWLLALAFLFTTQHHVKADIILTTDVTWSTTEISPGTGWNSSPSYDVSSWGPAYIIYEIPFRYSGIAASPSISGPSQTWLRKTFELTAAPTVATLSWFFDDDGEVYINGNLVYSDSSGLANNEAAGLDISSYLFSGTNVIAARIQDYGGYRYAGGQIYAETAAVPEPSSIMLTSVMLLFAFRCRNSRLRRQ